MSEQEPKGFRVVDRRRFAGEAREEKEAPPAERPEGAPSAPPQAPPSAAAPPRGGERPAGGPAGGSAGTAAAPQGRRADAGPGEQGRVGGPTFLDLVGTLHFGAMANLGMIQTPDGRRPPVNLPAAKDSIDLLGILQEKTKGNLTPEESEVLTEGLYHIRMAYVAALKAAAPEPGGKKK